MMRPNASFHTDETARKIGKADRNLAARQLLAQHNRTSFIKADNVETVFADINADGQNRRLGCLLRHDHIPFRVHCSSIGALV